MSALKGRKNTAWGKREARNPRKWRRMRAVKRAHSRQSVAYCPLGGNSVARARSEPSRAN